MRGYSHLKEEAPDRTVWTARFLRGFGPILRQTTKWMNDEYIILYRLIYYYYYYSSMAIAASNILRHAEQFLTAGLRIYGTMKTFTLRRSTTDHHHTNYYSREFSLLIYRTNSVFLHSALQTYTLQRALDSDLCILEAFPLQNCKLMFFRPCIIV